ncbi:MAG: PEP/pyruvate-binding domain-containing protein [Anaerolineae bacterium]|nr:PEP/pyruvate-binding domain-containing protein [Anaerolineae bacterium]
MKDRYVIALADPEATLERVGGKGASLARLVSAGLPVPGGFHVTTAAYRRFVAENDLQPRLIAALAGVNASVPASLEAASARIRELFSQASLPSEIAQAVAHAYTALPGEPAVAVRSSATAEDQPEFSFAGQQETFLNVRGVPALLEALQRCWASLWTARAIGYRLQRGIGPEALAMGVVVQALVPAEAAGVLFTAHPVTGRRDQAMISAAWGLGEAVVTGAVTPDTLIVDKASGRVLERQTADKQVMTVAVEAGTEERPVPAEQRCAAVLDDPAAARLTGLGVRIEELYGRPMDVEWALAGGEFAIVQARPITALPEPAALAIDWSVRSPKDRYMRVSICELMPHPLSPLFATLGLSALERGINEMAEDLTRMPRDVLSGLLQTVNGYAYQYVSFTGRQWWMLLTRMVPRMPRLMRHGVAYWQNVAHPRYEQTVARWSGRPLQEMTVTELFAGFREVLDAFAHHVGALMGSTMGPAAGSEGLFTRIYEKLVMRPGDPPAPAFLMGYDSAPIRAEKALYDLALWCRERAELAAYLTATPTDPLIARLTNEEPPEGVPASDWSGWQRRFREYLDRHGYSIYDMDLMAPLPMERPGPMLETLKLFITGQGRDPYERQRAFAERREKAVQSVRSRLRGLRRWAFEKALRWAQSLAPLREDGIAEVGLGYPVLRRMLRELGRRFCEAGMIEQPEDIYWLEEAEIERAVADLERGGAPAQAHQEVRARKALWQVRSQVTPPPMLPPKARYLGMSTEGWIPSRGEDDQGQVIRGVGASAGCVTAAARLLRGPEDFSQMRPGEVLVATITTPAWTPLFAMAAAIVTDIGGPLSHGSIVAREYGIPAVLGTGVATRRIVTGQVVTVDGTAGTVAVKRET